MTSDSFGIVDCDSHFTEPPDLWSSRVPKSLADRVPVQTTVDGRTYWFLNGESWASVGGNTIEKGRKKIRGTMTLHPFDLIDEAAWSVPARLALLDEIGVEAQVLYPNGVGFASNHIFAIEDPDQRTLILQTYNDFGVDIQHESGGRLLPQSLLPTWDMDLTIKEIERLLDKGITGFTLSDKPELLGLPELPEPYWAPMWSILNDSGAVANFHIGSGQRKQDIEKLRAAAEGRQDAEGGKRAVPDVAPLAWNYLPYQRRFAVTSSQFPTSNMRIIVNLCMSDLFDRFPDLKIVSAESGIGWVPFILESMEWQLDEMVTHQAELALQTRRPTEYFRGHIYVMFWFERLVPKYIDDIGVDNILVETDVPHPTCLYPGPREHFDKVLAGVSPEAKRKIIHDNAAKLYGLDRALAAD